MIDTADRLARYVTGMYGPPAFVLRQKAVDAAWDTLIAKCRRVRADMLNVVAAYARSCGREFGIVLNIDPDVAVHDLLELLAGRSTSTTSSQATSWNNLVDAVVSFNRKWRDYVQRIDLREVNQVRADYNQWYLIEKEAALKSERVARMGYQPLNPLSLADIVADVPRLPTLSKHPVAVNDSTTPIYLLAGALLPIGFLVSLAEIAAGGRPGIGWMLIPLGLLTMAATAVCDSMNRRITQLEHEVERLRDER